MAHQPAALAHQVPVGQRDVEMGGGHQEERKSARGSPNKRGGRGGGLTSDAARGQRQKNAAVRQEEAVIAQGVERTATMLGGLGQGGQ